jgi:deoxyribonuclease-1
MRKYGVGAGLFLAMCLALSPGASAGWDSVALSDSLVAFGVVTTGETTSVQMSITNHLGEPVDITCAGATEQEFWTNLAPMELQPLATEVFDVYFTSAQNIDYTAFLSIELSGGVRPLIAELTAEAHHPGTYYSSTRNLWAEDLKDALTDIIDGHTSLGYTIARDYMYGSVDNHDGWVECVYTGRTAFFNTRAGATANNFNCEHTWPQSFSDEDEPMRSDLFHLYPSDITANSMRAALDFGIVTSVTWSQGGSKLGYDSTSQQVFEPRDVHKGNVARTHFYYIIRYDGQYDEYVDSAKMEAHFRNWHISDPVDSLEILRNEDIYALQNNRNPFIDHPAFVDRISSFFGTAVRVTEPEIAVSPVEIDMGTIGYDYTAHYFLAIVNGGDDSLHIDSMTSSNPDFVLSKSSTALYAGTYEYIRLSYTSGSIGTDDSTTVQISSDDADESLIQIPVTIHVTDLAGVEREGDSPEIFRLRQNSPNPFGERTTISFSLPRASDVRLSVYNTRGQLVRTLVHGDEMPPGEHQVVFETGSLPSGVYYCRLRAGDRVDTKRMVLIN